MEKNKGKIYFIFNKIDRKAESDLNLTAYWLDALSGREVESTEIVANLEKQKVALNEYLNELLGIGQFLEAWQPVQR